MPGCDEDTNRLAALEEEVVQLREAVVSHAVIDQAIGVVISVGGLRPEQGWDVLREVSQHTNIKLREVARCLVHWPSTEQLPAGVRRALSAAVARARDAAALGENDAMSGQPVR
ncbi:ANTAR domain-containing protein [Streptomyces sp. NPDC001817]|uniref:ANTAR domain-containing protein n=1 Tax=Streptomyces sp. NPDC001817 TaxID=3154398 RepID=UPI00331BB9A8